MDSVVAFLLGGVLGVATFVGGWFMGSRVYRRIVDELLAERWPTTTVTATGNFNLEPGGPIRPQEQNQ